MKNKLNKNFKTLCEFLGHGNIESKIWFVGIEEGGDNITKDNLQEQLSICRNITQFIPSAKGNTSVWKIIADLLRL